MGGGYRLQATGDRPEKKKHAMELALVVTIRGLLPVACSL
jgi:hypothetical protein